VATVTRLPEVAFATLIALVLIEAWPTLVLGAAWRSRQHVRVDEEHPDAVLARDADPADDTANTLYMYFSTALDADGERLQRFRSELLHTVAA
jgi:hypothetical protein